MERKGIRIIEFGDDGEPVRRPRSGLVREDGVSGSAAADDRHHIATPETVGPVKIKEFDEEPKRPVSGHASPATPVRESIKIREFGKERDVPPPRRSGVKIVEFD